MTEEQFKTIYENWVDCYNNKKCLELISWHYFEKANTLVIEAYNKQKLSYVWEIYGDELDDLAEEKIKLEPEVKNELKRGALSETMQELSEMNSSFHKRFGFKPENKENSLF